MFERIASFVARHARVVALAWFALAGLLFVAARPLRETVTQDQTAFLSATAPSIVGAVELSEIWPKDEFSQSGALVFAREEALTRRDRAFVRQLERWLHGPDAPDNVRVTASAFSRPEMRDVLVAADGRAMLLVIGFTTPPFEPDTNEAVAEIRAHARATAPDGLTVHLTGTAGVAADQSAAIRAAIDRTTVITLVLVTLILLWIYRSAVTWLIPLATIGVAFQVSSGVISLLAEAGLKVSALAESFMVVIIFGAGTDYCLFIVSRFKEELHRGADARRTLIGTMAIIGGVIASSAATVIVGFGSQSAAEFGMFRTMGPAMAIAVAVTLAAGLTLTPALLRIAGRWAFWPQRIGAPEGPLAPEPEALAAADRVEDRPSLPAAKERVAT